MRRTIVGRLPLSSEKPARCDYETNNMIQAFLGNRLHNWHGHGSVRLSLGSIAKLPRHKRTSNLASLWRRRALS